MVNDGSTDNSYEICKQLSNTDCRIKLFTKKNEGGVLTRKYGIQKSVGEYVLLADADDYVDDDYVESAVQILQKEKDIDILKFAYITEPDGIKHSICDLDENVYRDNKKCIYDCLLYSEPYCLNHVWNEFVKKELFDFDDEIFNEIVHKGEDLQINLQIFKNAKNVYMCNKAFYHYICNPNGITSNYTPRKVISNCKDSITLYNCKQLFANFLDLKVDEVRLKEKTIYAVNDKIINIITMSNNAKEDLQIIENEIGRILIDYFKNYTYKDLKCKNWIIKKMHYNIIRGDIKKNLGFRWYFKLKSLIKKGA